MGLIFKIAAGIIIGLMAVQIASVKWLSYENRKQGEKIYLAQELRNKSIMFMNSVHFYYKENERLPQALSDLDCIQHRGCAVGEKDSVFYLKHENEWMLIQPYLISSDIEFLCKATFLDRLHPRFHHCIKIDASEIPQSIKESA